MKRRNEVARGVSGPDTHKRLEQMGLIPRQDPPPMKIDQAKMLKWAGISKSRFEQLPENSNSPTRLCKRAIRWGYDKAIRNKSQPFSTVGDIVRSLQKDPASGDAAAGGPKTHSFGLPPKFGGTDSPPTDSPPKTDSPSKTHSPNAGWSEKREAEYAARMNEDRAKLIRNVANVGCCEKFAYDLSHHTNDGKTCHCGSAWIKPNPGHCKRLTIEEHMESADRCIKHGKRHKSLKDKKTGNCTCGKKWITHKQKNDTDECECGKDWVEKGANASKAFHDANTIWKSNHPNRRLAEDKASGDSTNLFFLAPLIIVLMLVLFMFRKPIQRVFRGEAKLTHQRVRIHKKQAMFHD